jgi:hypothetical protein
MYSIIATFETRTCMSIQAHYMLCCLPCLLEYELALSPGRNA